MRQPDEFDAFYKDARERLLAQTYAMTGDLGASRRAVRDAFVVAWHHWRKVSRRDRPEDVVRPQAWRLAQRRATARVWHREKDLDPDVKATLDALGKLPVAQRKALVLTQLASVSMPQMAREIGLPLEAAERELQSATSALTLTRDVEAVELRALFERLGASVAGRGRWPRSTIVRRAGAARRRTHTALGAAGAVAALVVTGSLVTDAAGVRPSLDIASDSPSSPPSSEAGGGDAVEVALPEETLLSGTDVRGEYAERTWTVQRTNDNSTGNGMVLPCQAERYADPRGKAALLRVFEASASRGQEPASGMQLTEASATPRAATRAFDATTAWFAGCLAPRTQLLSTATAKGLGDQSVLFVLRSWTDPVTTHVVGVARTGLYTTTTVVSRGGDAAPDRAAATQLLASGVDRLCSQPDGGACAPADPELTDRPPLPAGPAPSMISEVDLPPVARVEQPWVGTEPRRAITNTAATGCDETSFEGAFQGARFTRDASRTFLVPEADLPREFGLTQTVAALPPVRATALVQQVRDRLASCTERDLNTDVEQIVDRDERTTDLTAWRLDVEITDTRSITFWMAILRDGTSVAQVGFVPAGGATLESEQFVALAERALERLAELPPPKGG